MSDQPIPDPNQPLPPAPEGVEPSGSTDGGGDPAGQAAQPDPWTQWVEAGVKPDDPVALSAWKRGQAIYDPRTRREAILDVILQDQNLQAELADLFAPPPVTPGLEPLSFDDGGYGGDPGGYPQGYGQGHQPAPQGDPGYATQQDVMDTIVQSQLVSQLASVDGVNDQQKAELFNRAWANYQQGSYTAQTLATAINDELGALRSMWGPGTPGGQGSDDQALRTAQALAAQRQGAPAPGIDTGVAPGGDPEPQSIAESAQLALRQLQQMQGQGQGY